MVADGMWNRRNLWIGEGASLTPSVLDEMYDSVVEIIDPVKAKLVASTRLPFWSTGFAGPGRLSHVYDKPGAGRKVDIIQLTLSSAGTP
jgi:hypothetical protein